jgi:hypothetical protein
MSPAAAYEGAVSELVNDTYCRGCRVAETAEQRQIALLRACVDDARVANALAIGHGPCLRHAIALAAGGAARPVLRHLATRLREVQWDLGENVRKQAWDARHEPAGTEQTVWRRVPMLLDGEVYLGVAETEVWSPGQSSGLDAQAPRRR